MNLYSALIGLGLWLTLCFILPIPAGTSYPATRRPFACYGLMLINLLAYLYQHWIGPLCDITAAETIATLGFHYSPDAPWQLLTHLFLHSGLAHLIFNLFFLYMIAVPLEDKIGPARLVFIYLAGGMIAALGHGYLSWGAMQSTDALIGASGAIATLIGAFFIIHPWVDFHFSVIYWIMIILAGTHRLEIGAIICFIFFFAAEQWFYNLGNIFSHAIGSQMSGGDYHLATPHWALLCGTATGLVWAGGLYGFKAFLKTHTSDIAQQRQIQRNLQRSMKKGTPSSVKSPAKAPSATILTHLVSQGNAQSARSEFIRLMEESPKVTLAPEPQLELAKLLAGLGERDLCLKALANLLTASPEAKEAGAAHFLAGEVLSQNQSDHPSATEHLKQAMARIHREPDRQRAGAMLHLIENGQTPPSRYTAQPKGQQTSLSQPDMTHLHDTPQLSLLQPGENRNTAAHLVLNPLSYNENDFSAPAISTIGTPNQAPPLMELLPLGAFTQQQKPAKTPEIATDYSTRTLNDQISPDADLNPAALRHVIEFPYENRSESLTGLASSPESLCTLILEPTRNLDTAGLVQTLSGIFHSSPENVAGRLKLQAGIIHPEITHTEGVRLRDRLLSVGIRCALIEHSPVWGTTSSTQAHTVRIEPNLWIFETGERTIRVAPNELQLLTCGRLCLTPGGTQKSRLLDIVRLGPQRAHVRLWEESFTLLSGQAGSSVSKSKGNVETMQRLALMLTQTHPNAIQTLSFRQWQTTDHHPADFKNLSLYDNSTKWHLMARYAPRV